MGPYRKAVTLISLQNFEEAINYCQKAIANHPAEEGLETVYVTYGNALDFLKQSEKAIEIYDEGINQFPGFYQLYFNKGISLSSTGRLDEAMICFQQAIMINPNHAGSHNAIAKVSTVNSRRIPALLAYWRFLVLEPEGNRAKENLKIMLRVISMNVAQPSKDSITIRYDPGVFTDTIKTGSPNGNNFISTDLMLSMDAGRDYLPEFKDKPDVEKFIRKLDSVCASLIETKEGNSGFFWEYYVPYFIEMKRMNFLETYSYIAFISSGDPGIIKWINAHNIELEKFLNWSTSFEWKTK